MAAAATASAVGPRYAPDDPTLPKPWKGLVDGKTGYLYYWNPETNVTQYDKPRGTTHPTKLPSVPLSSSVQQSSQREDDRYGRGSNGVSKIDGGSRSHQTARVGQVHPQDALNVRVSDAYGGSSTRGCVSSGVGSSLSVESYRRQHEITVTGNDVPAPFMSFDTTGFPPEILQEVLTAGFSAPTPIQAQSWPVVLQSHDIVAVAKTGSGKTLGYLIPGFIHLKRCRNNPKLGPTMLILAPTRELATQIQNEAVKFSKTSKISCTCLYGGAPKGPQLRDIDRGVDIVVATPGRLNDILEMKRISLHQVSYLVLDEADRMLDMGFEPQIRKIVKEVPSRRQTLMYTATWPKEVRKIAADLLVNPVQVNIGKVDELVANKSITQHIEVCPPMEKHKRLELLLRSQEPGSKVIIFCSTKKMCDQLSRSLTRYGAAAIHGDKSQGERDYVLNQFRLGRSPILVATDVAARGLDVKDIRVVINYDFPTGIEDYVHRIGRTGRAGASGLSHTFFSEQDAKHASDLVKVLEGANQRVPPEIRDMASRSSGMGKSRRWGFGSGGRGGRSDSGYGGRGGWGIQSSSSFGRPERGGGRGYDSRDRNTVRSRSRSRSPDRYDRGPRERSPVYSYNRSMLDRGRSPLSTQHQHHAAPYNNKSKREHIHSVRPQSPRNATLKQRSPFRERGEGGHARGPRLSFAGEEEEEGMIHPDENGAF